MSDMLRITGLVSGMDTDTTVKKLIQVEQIKVDKANQEKQYMEWQRDDYREVANLIRGFQDTNFDVLKPDSNIRSTAMFDMFAGTATIAGVESSAVSIKTTSNSIVGDLTINSVTQLATKDKYQSGSEVLGNILTGNMGTIGDINAQIVIDNKLSFSFDGVSKTIELDQTGYADYAAFASDLTAKLQAEFTNVDIVASVSGTDQLEFNIYGSGTLVEETGHSLVVNAENADLLADMSLTSGTSNSVSVYKSLSDVFGVSGDSTMTINGVDFTFTDDTTIANVMNEINTSEAGVTITYDNFSDTFTMESTKVGSDSAITLTDTDGLLATFKLQGGAETHTAPVNAEFVVNGVTTTRSSNTFDINGTTVTLNEVPVGAININVAADTSDVKDKIIKFVDNYNEMIEKIGDLLSTTKNYDYAPLTSAQKEDMTDDDIEAWEKEARKGTLRNDSALENITRDLRTSLYESVDGLGITLYDLGIQTSGDYTQRGQLVINETKLDAALNDRPNEVIELFTKQSDTSYTSFSDRGTRNSENGIGYRIYDILQDNIRLTRNDNGNKGYLIDKAGLDTGTDATSNMAKKLLDMDEKIADLLEMLANQEDKYYSQFAAMESAMSSYQSQSSWLSSQFGG